MKARVTVMPKSGVLDPEGRAIAHALGSLGFAGVEEVRAGKVIEVTLAEQDPEKARLRAKAGCRRWSRPRLSSSLSSP
jgi:phosphoribosylformylglycinamidine synthase PurS subunit